MVIAVAINGEGMGHAARCVCLVRLLQEDHRVVVWAPRTVLAFLRAHLPGTTIHHLPLLSFARRKHRIRALPTLARNASRIAAMPRITRRLARWLEREGIDGVISDYEPFLSRAGISLGIPVVTFCHQAVLDRYPDFTPQGIAARLVNRYMIPARVDHVVSTSFFDGDVGPLVRRELLDLPKVAGRSIVVYAPDWIRATLRKVLPRDQEFRFRFFPSNRLDYLVELASARAVIAPAGHQTLSEALCLDKPVLVIPQPGQNEQELNARMAQRSGRARVGRIEHLADDVAGFLLRIDDFPFSLPDPDVKFVLRDDTHRATCVLERLLVSGRRRRWWEPFMANRASATNRAASF